MYGNGVRITMAVTVVLPKRTRRDPHRALIACFVGAVGTTPPGAAVYPVGTAARQAAGTTTVGSVLLSSSFTSKENQDVRSRDEV